MTPDNSKDGQTVAAQHRAQGSQQRSVGGQEGFDCPLALVQGQAGSL